jgi:ABC-type Na+ efflux pump permease subunit
LNTSSLLWSLLFSSIGLGFFSYGKKQKAIVPLICGLILMVFPYFVSGSIPLVSIGTTLVAIPYFIRI